MYGAPGRLSIVRRRGAPPPAPEGRRSAQGDVAGVEALDMAVRQLHEQRALLVDACGLADHGPAAGLHADAALEEIVALAELPERVVEPVAGRVEIRLLEREKQSRQQFAAIDGLPDATLSDTAVRRSATGSSLYSVFTLRPMPITTQSMASCSPAASRRMPPTLRSSINRSFGHLIRTVTGTRDSMASQAAAAATMVSRCASAIPSGRAQKRREQQPFAGG